MITFSSPRQPFFLPAFAAMMWLGSACGCGDGNTTAPKLGPSPILARHKVARETLNVVFKFTQGISDLASATKALPQAKLLSPKYLKAVQDSTEIPMLISEEEALELEGVMKESKVVYTSIIQELMRISRLAPKGSDNWKLIDTLNGSSS